MLRIACCLLLLQFPAIVSAQQPEETLPQLSETKETAKEPDSPDAGSARIVMIEVTMLQIAGHLQVDDPGNIDVEKLQQAFRDSQEQGSFRHLTRVKLSTLEENEAIFQMGANEAVPQGTTRGFSRGGDGRPTMATSYRFEQTGTIVSTVPRVNDDGTIVVKLQFEQSRLRPTPPASGEDATTTLPATDRTTVNTTLTIPNGQTVLAGAFQSADTGNEPLETFVIVGASTRK
ncbi:Bacterial type II and III secretion system protein [Maioricimonas rarisocia]|uniref:Bacterial type II and III secretion system protein n=1 Tax=Maioricimonas rarisocia TaxID=2528026 RepID=A0A517ZFJ3_9PLAN|nr:type II and III secretion system protein [Maioricimonas rarisocia]QDU41212.1 Bacterial type II and III secretion system protein [Maioricimonas rarisocia]